MTLPEGSKVVRIRQDCVRRRLQHTLRRQRPTSRQEPARVGARATQVKAAHRRVVARPAPGGPHREPLVQRHIAVESVPAPCALPLLDVGGRQQLGRDDQRADARRVVLEQTQTGGRQPLALGGPVADLELPGRGVHVDGRDVCAGRRQGVVEDRWDRHFHPRSGDQSPYLWRRLPAPGSRATGRCGPVPKDAPAARLRETRQRRNARFNLATEPLER